LENIESKKALAELTRLLAAAATVEEAGPEDPAFQNWHRDSLTVLRRVFGDGDHRVASFRKIDFSITPGLLETAKRRAPKIVHDNITFLLSTKQAEMRHFQSAVTEAISILRTAKAALEIQ